MWFPYAFTNPDETGLQRRRHLLDRYGQVAQLSALIPLLAFQAPFLFRRLKSQFDSPRIRRKAKQRTSPVVERFGALSGKADGTRNSIWNRVAWRLDQELSPGWGTWRVLLVAASWMAWLFVLAVRDTGDGMSRVYLFYTFPTSAVIVVHQNATKIVDVLCEPTEGGYMSDAFHRLPASDQTLWHRRRLPTPSPLPSRSQIPPLPHHPTHPPLPRRTQPLPPRPWSDPPPLLLPPRLLLPELLRPEIAPPKTHPRSRRPPRPARHNLLLNPRHHRPRQNPPKELPPILHRARRSLDLPPPDPLLPRLPPPRLHPRIGLDLCPPDPPTQRLPDQGPILHPRAPSLDLPASNLHHHPSYPFPRKTHLPPRPTHLPRAPDPSDGPSRKAPPQPFHHRQPAR